MSSSGVGAKLAQRVGAIMCALGLVMAGATILMPVAEAAASTGTGTGISYTLEGCKASTAAYIAPGSFICPDANYTTGNLGKGWNEFDLVPGRVILGAGQSAPATQTYSFVIAVDNCSTPDGQTGCSTGHPGYDRLSSDSGGVPTINTNLSSSSGCGSIAASDPAYAPPAGGAIGGTGTSLYRTITITGQAANTTCTYDFYARLAFNSHLYPGSSLHFDLANTDLGTAGIGAKDVSIPVSAILPPGFTKSQTSTQGSSVVWGVSKTSDPTSLSFLNTCSSATGSTTRGVTTTVAWTKTTSADGATTVVGHITVQNNAHRTIDVSVSDQLYDGASNWTINPDGSPIVTTHSLSAGQQISFDDIFTPSSTTETAYSDQATATFTDPVFADTLGTTTAQATSAVQVLNAESGLTATIQDIEQMSGSTDFDFSIDAASTGSFGSYVLGTQSRGPLTWSSGPVTASGSATFTKTVYVLQPTTGTATLSDTATLTPAGEAVTTASSSTVINGDATVSIVIAKSLSTSQTTDKTFTFNATGADSSTGSTTIVIPAGTSGPVQGTINGLHPGVLYTIDEPAVTPFPAQSLTDTVNLPSCSDSLAVVNTAPTTTTTVPPTTTSTIPPTTTSTIPPTTTSTIPNTCCVVIVTTTSTVPPTTSTVAPTTSTAPPTTLGSAVLPAQGSTTTTVAPTTAAPTTVPTAVLPVTGTRTLPFTGGNVRWLFFAGVVLVLLGLSLLAEGRRTSGARHYN